MKLLLIALVLLSAGYIQAGDDLAPTILDLARLTPSSTMQGESPMNIIDEKAAGREVIFCKNLYTNRSDPLCDIARTKKWKYIDYFGFPELKAELYDLEKDRFESNDLMDNPEYAAVVAEMKGKLEASRVKYSGPKLGWVDVKVVATGPKPKGAKGDKSKKIKEE